MTKIKNNYAIKKINWVGTSLEDLKSMPDNVKKELGGELYSVQCGLYPSNYKPISSIGKGIIEIKYKEKNNEYRVVYVTVLKDAIYVLHAFIKKTQKISNKDKDIIKQRYKDIIR